jgi:hypothetical protein
MMRVPRNPNQRAPFTGGKYIKVCSENVDDLRGWIRDKGASDFSKLCQICRPFDKTKVGSGWHASTDIEAVRDGLEQNEQLDPHSVEDSRRRILQAIVVRQGGSKFRAELIEAYDGKCAATGCDVPAALEAAHIHPYRGAETNLVSNGLLLRADIHTLFDLGLIAVDGAGRWVIAEELANTTYATLAGQQLGQPKEQKRRPDPVLLRWHFEENGFVA